MKNQNLYTKKYRYKLVEKNSNKVSEVVMQSKGPMEMKNTTVYTSSLPARKYVPYEYKFYFFRKLWWSIKTWYKRHKKKNIKDIIINSTTSKWLGKLLFGIFIAVIGGLILLIIWALFETELTEYFRTLKN
jgi:hypothetical protein